MLNKVTGFDPSQTYTLTEDEIKTLQQINDNPENPFSWFAPNLLTMNSTGKFDELFNWKNLMSFIQIELLILGRMNFCFKGAFKAEVMPYFFINTFIITISCGISAKEHDETHSINCITYLAKYLLSYDMADTIECWKCVVLPYIQRILSYIYYAQMKKMI